MSINPLKYQPTKLTTAQRLLIAMGLDDLRLVAHHGGKRETFTKKGPGRQRPQQSKREATSEETAAMQVAAASAAPGLFLGQHTTSVQRKRRRGMVKAMGIRQFKRYEQKSRPNYPWPDNSDSAMERAERNFFC